MLARLRKSEWLQAGTQLGPGVAELCIGCSGNALGNSDARLSWARMSGYITYMLLAVVQRGSEAVFARLVCVGACWVRRLTART